MGISTAEIRADYGPGLFIANPVIAERQFPTHWEAEAWAKEAAFGNGAHAYLRDHPDCQGIYWRVVEAEKEGE